MAASYIYELGDKLSHGVANTDGNRVKILAPVYYTDGSNHPSIATALAGKAASTHPHDITRTADTANGDKLQIGTGTAVNVTNSAHAASADKAAKITTSAKIGDTNKPVYVAADGTVTAISYTIATSVPSGAVFTDTKQRIVSSTSKAYLTGVTTSPTSSNQDLTGVANTAVYMTDGTMASTKVKVGEACTLQYNSTTQSLDFVF